MVNAESPISLEEAITTLGEVRSWHYYRDSSDLNRVVSGKSRKDPLLTCELVRNPHYRGRCVEHIVLVYEEVTIAHYTNRNDEDDEGVRDVILPQADQELITQTYELYERKAFKQKKDRDYARRRRERKRDEAYEKEEATEKRKKLSDALTKFRSIRT